MSNPMVDRYKLPFLFSLVVSLAVIVLSEETSKIMVLAAFAGSFVGILLIDLEYLIHAYLIDPSSEISARIKEHVSERKFKDLIALYNREEFTFGELSIRSAIFQVMLSVMALMSITNHTWTFARGMILTMTITLLYFQFQEFIKTGTIRRWFWVFKGELSTAFYKFYMFMILVVFIYQFTLL